MEASLQQAQALGPVYSKAFLCDGDALILSTERLLQILEGIRKYTPWIQRVGVYGDTRSVKRKSADALRQLQQAGLQIVYHGVESGDDEVLAEIDKGGTRAECVETAQKLREAKITHSVMVLLGIGGARLSQQHAANTASLLTLMDPPFVGALTTTVVPQTPLAVFQSQGRFALPGKFELLQELRVIIEQSSFSACRFSANHASNYLPLRANLPQEKEALLEALDAVIATNDPRLLKPETLRGL